MYPHERSLVKRMKGKPFVLLGINSDSRARLRATIKREHITWRSWWDGGSTAGPIASKWNVIGWPTLYLIDAKGIIRHKSGGLRGVETWDRWVDQLVAQAAAH